MVNCGYCAARGERKSFPNRAALARHVGHSKECRQARAARQEAIPESDSEHELPQEDEEDEPLDANQYQPLIEEPPASPPGDREGSAAPQPSRSGSVTIEDVPEDTEPDHSPRASGWARYAEQPTGDQLRAGESVRADSSVFDRIRESQEENGQTRYGPLANEEIAEVAEFIVECVGKNEADRFFKLARVRNCFPWSRRAPLLMTRRYAARPTCLGVMSNSFLILSMIFHNHNEVLCAVRSSISQATSLISAGSLISNGLNYGCAT
jgi:hypothetical protein